MAGQEKAPPHPVERGVGVPASRSSHLRTCCCNSWAAGVVGVLTSAVVLYARGMGNELLVTVDKAAKGTVLCDDVKSSCVCGLASGHDGPHECDCGGSWDVDGSVVRWPGIFGDLF